MSEIYIRNIIFGIVDSLVSTVGLLAGVGIGGTPRAIIILTGVVYAFVEAFSMAVGSFLSEESAEEYLAKKETADGKAIVAGAIMFVSFVLASFIPILPYLLFGASYALFWSVVFSGLALFVAGAVIAKISKLDLWRHGLKMVLLGSTATIIGIIVGKLIKIG